MHHLSARCAAILDVAATDIVPELAAASPERWDAFHAIVDLALEERPRGVRRQFAVFLLALALLPLGRFGAPYRRLAAERRRRVLQWLQDRAPGRLRQGFWGLKTLVFMGYYSQGAVAGELAYRPSFSGNEHLHA